MAVTMFAWRVEDAEAVRTGIRSLAPDGLGTVSVKDDSQV